MGWRVAYEPDTGKITSFYHTDRHKNIPDSAIEVDTQDYLQATFNPNQYRVDPLTKTLQKTT